VHVLVLNWLDRGNPAAGGAETHLHETFGRIVTAGWQVTLVSSGWPGSTSRAELDGIRIHRVGTRLTYPVPAVRHARRLLREGDVDLVVEDLNKAPLFTPTWSRRPLLLLVHHLFGGTVFQEAGLHLALPTWLLEKPIPSIYRDVPVVAVSESTRDDLARRGMDRGRITVIPNGIDVGAFRPAPPGGRFEEPTALYLGRLKKYKRVDLVLRAVARVRDEHDLPLTLLVAGKGDHRERLEAEAEALGLVPDGVRFLGYVDEDRKRELLARAWVHCLTSPKEGWGIANLEAAASGTPTIASDSPGLRDSVVHGTTGFLVPHGDTAALAHGLARLVRDPDLRDRLGRGGRAFAAGFSWERTAGRMMEVMQGVVASY
jgi:glycosyltransferase involved in cell wall biosynthesis